MSLVSWTGWPVPPAARVLPVDRDVKPTVVEVEAVRRSSAHGVKARGAEAEAASMNFWMASIEAGGAGGLRR